MTKRKITTLTDAQWSDMYALREDYRAAGLCTAPADRATTERIITGFYTRIGKPAPGFVWVDGPLSAILVYNLLLKLAKPTSAARQLWSQLGSQLESQLRSQLGSQLESQLESQLGSQLGSQLESQLGSQLESQLRLQLWSQLESQLGSQLESQLWSQLWSQLRSQLRSQLESQLESQLRSQLESQLWSQLESQLWSQLRSQLESQLESGNLRFPDYFAGGEWLPWVALYRACAAAGVQYTAAEQELLGEWNTLMRASGWWFPFDGLVICAERHKAVSFDAEHRLHCETGPAIECRDGFKVYVWHGTNIPSEWIEKRAELDPQTALTWKNVEQRRCAAEIIGWARILDALKPAVVDQDKDPMIGTLLRVDLPDSPREQFLRVRCGTGRDFCLPVPPDMKTALQAQAWMYQLDESTVRNYEART